LSRDERGAIGHVTHSLRAIVEIKLASQGTQAFGGIRHSGFEFVQGDVDNPVSAEHAQILNPSKSTLLTPVEDVLRKNAKQSGVNWPA
jgi:hypothetical protein